MHKGVCYYLQNVTNLYLLNQETKQAKLMCFLEHESCPHKILRLISSVMEGPRDYSNKRLRLPVGFSLKANACLRERSTGQLCQKEHTAHDSHLPDSGFRVWHVSHCCVRKLFLDFLISHSISLACETYCATTTPTGASPNWHNKHAAHLLQTSTRQKETDPVLLRTSLRPEVTTGNCKQLSEHFSQSGPGHGSF